MHDVFYVDYGNAVQLPSEELCETVPEVWNIPPIAKPFRVMGKSVGQKILTSMRFYKLQGMEFSHVGQWKEQCFVS